MSSLQMQAPVVGQTTGAAKENNLIKNDSNSNSPHRQGILDWWQVCSNFWSFIPLEGKVPVEREWQQWSYQLRPFNRDVFNGRNAGLVCGPASNALVIDVDDLASFNKFCCKNNHSIPETFTVQTGKGNPHSYFTYPKDGRQYGNKSFKKFGFDIRGAGGQVVAPGSIHPETGRQYTVQKDIPLAPPPEWLLKLYDETPTATVCRYSGDINALPIAADNRALIVFGSQVGDRSEAMMTVLNSLAGAGLSDQDICAIFEQYAIGDKYREKGANRVKWLAPQITKARKFVATPSAPPATVGPNAAAGWLEPQPLPSKNFKALPYPVDALPHMIKGAVIEVHNFVKSPIPMIAASALSAISVACQGFVNVERARTLTGPCSLNFLTVGDSGERKTESDRRFLETIRGYDSMQAELSKPAIKKFQAEHSAWEANRTGLLETIKKAAKQDNLTPELKEKLNLLQQHEPEAPRYPQYLLLDETPESLGLKLSTGWPSAGIISSEAGIIFGAHGMSSEIAMRNLSLLNILWDGGVYEAGRKSVENVRVESARLTLGLQVQEKTLRTFFDRSSGLARGSGFLARFLFSWPKSTMGTRKFEEAPEHWPALAVFKNRLVQILNYPLPIENGRLEPALLTLSAPAKAAWIEFHDETEAALGCGGDLCDVCDIAAKAADNVARLAALFHSFIYGGPGPVDLPEMLSATKIVRWHLNESLRFYSAIAAPAELSDAARLDAWLLEFCHKMKVAAVPTRTVQQYGPGDLRNRKTIEATVTELSESNRARLIFDGRAKLIEVNPALLKPLSVAK